MTPEEALRTVLEVPGVEIPRAALGDDARALAAALSRPGAGQREIERLARRTATAHWPDLRGPVEAAIRRFAATAGPEEDEAFAVALAWAADEDAGNPLALGLAARAGAGLSAAMDRARDRLRAAEGAAQGGGRAGALAVASAAGNAVVDLLDIDVEDYEPEIVAFVDRDQTPAALDDLARVTGDHDVRVWAREVLRALDTEDAPGATEAVRLLAGGEAPDDAADDAVWVPAVLALADEAIALAMVSDGSRPPRG
jgi:hypothetical protein